MRPRRRGRPRKHIQHRDTGTPELVYKRALGLTTESLDLCLERGLITPEQHWCGIHLRWLYTLRFGAPGVRAIDPTHLGGIELSLDDPRWRERREAEYQHALSRLGPRLAAYLLGIAVHNERPSFLLPLLHAPSPGMAALRERELNRLRDGMEVLTRLWCRRRSLAPAQN